MSQISTSSRKALAKLLIAVMQRRHRRQLWRERRRQKCVEDLVTVPVPRVQEQIVDVPVPHIIKVIVRVASALHQTEQRNSTLVPAQDDASALSSELGSQRASSASWRQSKNIVPTSLGVRRFRNRSKTDGLIVPRR